MKIKMTKLIGFQVKPTHSILSKNLSGSCRKKTSESFYFILNCRKLKNGLEFRQMSIGTVKCSLATFIMMCDITQCFSKVREGIMLL